MIWIQRFEKLALSFRAMDYSKFLRQRCAMKHLPERAIIDSGPLYRLAEWQIAKGLGREGARVVEFDPEFPKNCPPSNAKPMAGTIFRGIQSLPISDSHFVCHARAGKPCNPRQCKSWGLSIWITEAHARHAQKALHFMRSWHIAAGSISVDDGVVLQTGGNSSNPEHHTFWPSKGCQLANRFSVVLRPIATSKDKN